MPRRSGRSNAGVNLSPRQNALLPSLYSRHRVSHEERAAFKSKVVALWDEANRHELVVGLSQWSRRKVRDVADDFIVFLDNQNQDFRVFALNSPQGLELLQEFEMDLRQERNRQTVGRYTRLVQGDDDSDEEMEEVEQQGQVRLVLM